MKFKNENFNELYEIMKELDGSDNYLSMHVSLLNPGKKDMRLTACITGSDEGKPQVNKGKAIASIIMAMDDNEDFRQIITVAADVYKEHEVAMNNQES